MQIQAVEPDSANVGDIIAIRGYGFGAEQGTSNILFQGIQASEIPSWSDSEITVVVPEGVPYGPVVLAVDIMAENPRQWDTAGLFVEAAPIQYRMLAFGDSITAGVSTSYGGYTYYLENLLDLQAGPTVIINAGKGGERTAAGLARFESTLTKWNDIQFVLLMEGSNDVTDSSGAGPLESIVGNLREMIRIARDDYGMSVILGTIPPRLSYEGDQAPPTTLELVQAIRDLAAEEGVPVADHYAYFTDTPDWETLFHDTLHPNDQGYAVLANSWLEGALENLLP